MSWAIKFYSTLLMLKSEILPGIVLYMLWVISVQVVVAVGPNGCRVVVDLSVLYNMCTVGQNFTHHGTDQARCVQHK